MGVDSFWYKDEHDEPLLSVMDRTMQGERVYPDRSPSVRVGQADSADFTPKELEVLRAITEGASNQKIAERLELSENTVKTHIKHLLAKTGSKNRTQLALRARVSGVVVSEEEI